VKPDGWSRVSQLYHAALAKDANERGRFLAQACGGDNALRREVESLLAHEGTAERFLRVPAIEMAANVMAEDAGGSLSGRQIGSYQVLSRLGAGGMGEVYRAHDPKLNRDIALKVLPELFALDRDRLARFKREAQVLASLNHPNIAAIYGLEESNPPPGSGQAVVQALVLELVEGPTLADRIARGPIPIDESLSIARQIAEALEAAHEQGIIHRDLKPTNIKLRPDGTVKVLDFGLAKAMEPVGRAPNASESPTITTPAMTQAGTILGTAAYMSPEQARGKPVDRRADIWAFGVVLFEMLSGRRAFDGETTSDVLAKVMEREPDWRALPSATPMRLRELLRRSLKKDPKVRLRDIGEARVQIDELLSGAPEGIGVPAILHRPSLWQRALPWASAGALAITLALIGTAVIALRRASDVTPGAGSARFTIAPPENMSFGGPLGGGTGSATQVAVSPDGRNIVFVAGAPPAAAPAFQIWLRPIAALAAQAIPGTEGGKFPFWSPDSRFIGFFAGGKLKKVAIAGGPPTVLCDSPDGRGGSWSRDNVLLFSPGGARSGRGLQRVSSAGGVPSAVTTVDPATGEDAHVWPHFLPDGRHFFYTAFTGPCCPAPKPSVIRIGSLDPADAAIPLLQAESSVSYASGHVVFARDGTLMAQPFDHEARQLTGEAVPLAENVSREGSRYVGVSVSEHGTLVYGSGGSSDLLQLTWFDRAGRALGTLGEAASYTNFALSPDDRRVAVSLVTGSPRNRDIWIIDIARNIRSRLTTDPGTDSAPVWSPDGTRIAFEGRRSGKASLRQQLADGTAADESLRDVSDSSTDIDPSSWSADGRFIAYTLAGGGFPGQSSSSVDATTADVWVLPLFGDRKPFPVAQTEFIESSGVFSPDGRWIAYTSSESGQPNVYVQPFLRAGGKYQVSRDGGSHPVWRADGKELFYLSAAGTMMAVPINATGQLKGGEPQTLFQPGRLILNRGQAYAVTKDGGRFLVKVALQESFVAPITVVVNWTAAIQK
jgi:serine/threonine protein kinase/Tol biopolymer transport system component